LQFGQNKNFQVEPDQDRLKNPIQMCTKNAIGVGKNSVLEENPFIVVVVELMETRQTRFSTIN